METYSASKIQSWLSWFLRGILVLGFLILFARLFDLQVIKGDYYHTLSENNRIRRVPIVAPRGNILDREGEILIGNRNIKKRIVFEKSGFTKSFDISGAQSDEIVIEPIRDYRAGSAFAHLGGYLGQVNEEEVGKVDPLCSEKGPRGLGSFIGRMGLEQMYDCTLSGIDGEELIEVDSMGKKIRTLGRKEPMAGADLNTTVSLGLQGITESLMKGKKGAVVVTDTSGRVLSLYSSPSFDPNIFVSVKTKEKIDAILGSDQLPLFNRVISGTFHPGSVFKPVVAVSALEEGLIDENFIYNDTGLITIKSPYGEFSYKNWYFTQYGGVEGEINLVKAIARSTDTFFYTIGEMVGIEKINDWADKFGLSEKTGIDIPGEIEGLVPSPQWKEKVKGERWFLGNTYHVSIGQGDIALTPIGINQAISAIASDGTYCTPYIVENKNTSYECIDLEISEKTISLVKDGMKMACIEGGTAYPFFDTKISVGCKTGTAQINNSEDTHAWFVFFAPAESPEIVATVLVEKGGEGSRDAAPIAREIFNWWFGKH